MLEAIVGEQASEAGREVVKGKGVESVKGGGAGTEEGAGVVDLVGGAVGMYACPACKWG